MNDHHLATGIIPVVSRVFFHHLCNISNGRKLSPYFSMYCILKRISTPSIDSVLTFSRMMDSHKCRYASLKLHYAVAKIYDYRVKSLYSMSKNQCEISRSHWFDWNLCRSCWIYGFLDFISSWQVLAYIPQTTCGIHRALWKQTIGSESWYTSICDKRQSLVEQKWNHDGKSDILLCVKHIIYLHHIQIAEISCIIALHL